MTGTCTRVNRKSFAPSAKRVQGQLCCLDLSRPLPTPYQSTSLPPPSPQAPSKRTFGTIHPSSFAAPSLRGPQQSRRREPCSMETSLPIVPNSPGNHTQEKQPVQGTMGQSGLTACVTPARTPALLRRSRPCPCLAMCHVVRRGIPIRTLSYRGKPTFPHEVAWGLHFETQAPENRSS